MANSFDSMNDFPSPPAATPSANIEQMLQQARQNPAAFEDYIKRTNPQAYRQAMQIRNSPNPRAIVAEMAKQKGVNPGILKMLGIQ